MTKNASFFSVLQQEDLTILVVENDISKNTVNISLTKEWNEKTKWNGKNTKNIIKKPKCLSQEEISALIEKYDLGEYLDKVTGLMKDGKHKKLLFFYEPQLDLRCVLACHNTNKKYVVGGLRRAPEAKSEMGVITDALCLCKGMSYRCAVADLPCSGVTLSVHSDHPSEDNEKTFFGFLAYIIDRYNIYVAPESGFSRNDINLLRSFTEQCVMDESGESNAISMAAMHSVYLTIKEALAFRYPDNPSVEGKTIVIQGLGAIGSSLAKKLLSEKAELVIADIDDAKVDSFLQSCENSKSITTVEFHSISMQMGHVFVPCAFSGVINRESLTDLDFHIIAGGANNVLDAPLHEDEIYLAKSLAKKGILYIPDWISNFGGAMYGISLFMEKGKTSLSKKQKQMEKLIHNLLQSILMESKNENVSPLEISYKKLDSKIY